MNVENHWTGISDETDPEIVRKLVKANTVAVDKNNEAGQASHQGRYDRATLLYKEALQMKIDAFGDMSVQAGITLNAMGENYLRAKSLDLAEDCLRKALKIRDDRSFGGLEIGPRNDAAATRDNLGQLFEEKGLFHEARAIRVKGAEKGETMCGSLKCSTPGGAMLATNQLLACGGCRSVFYCSKPCQKADWRSRHKTLCQAFCAGQGTSTS